MSRGVLHPALQANMWQKGHCPNPGGKPKGHVEEFRKLCDEALPENFQRLIDLYARKGTGAMVKFKILEYLIKCGGGEPDKTLNVNVQQTTYVEFLRQAGTAMVEAANIVEAEIIEQAEDQLTLPLLVEDTKPEESI